MTEQAYRLHDAAQRADVGDVTRLLAAGVDPNELDDQGMTPLHWAVYGGYEDVTEALLKGGADPDLRSWQGTTALWHAEDDFGLFTIADRLRRYGATKK
jgi:uncharacterized protein